MPQNMIIKVKAARVAKQVAEIARAINDIVNEVDIPDLEKFKEMLLSIERIAHKADLSKVEEVEIVAHSMLEIAQSVDCVREEQVDKMRRDFSTFAEEAEIKAGIAQKEALDAQAKFDLRLRSDCLACALKAANISIALGGRPHDFAFSMLMLSPQVNAPQVKGHVVYRVKGGLTSSGAASGPLGNIGR